jgi:4-hydroxy-tetrahydrodipicolinate synthase
MFPRLYVDLYNAAVAHDFEQIKLLQEKVLDVSTAIYTVGKYGSSYLKGLKCALSVMGLCDDYMADPFCRFGDEKRALIKEGLERIDWKSLM